MPATRIERALRDLDDERLRGLGSEGVARRLQPLATSFPDPSRGDDVQADLERLLDVLDRAERLLGKDPDLFTIRLMVLGNAGRADQALALAREAYDQAPGWQTAGGVANALRRRGDAAGAVEMFRKAAAHDPEDVSALLDAGDLLLDTEQWAAALESYEEALAREPEQPWAVPSSAYCRYRLTGEERWLDELRRLAEQAPDECGVEDVLGQLFGAPAGEDTARARELLQRP